MVDLKKYDLIIYDHGEKHFCLGRIVEIMDDWVLVQDIKMLGNESSYKDYHLEIVPHTIHLSKIKKSFGNISVDKFIEDYPEWQL